MDTILAKFLINDLEDTVKMMTRAVESEDQRLGLTAIHIAEERLAQLGRVFEAPPPDPRDTLMRNR